VVVIALLAGGLSYVFPRSRSSGVDSSGIEALHSKLRAAVVIVAVLATAAASVVAYLY
jgi:hypothetical protein